MTDEFSWPGYETLHGVFIKAIVRAAIEKGKERHADGNTFDKQPICEICRKVGIGFALGQAMKKIPEALVVQEKVELLDAINYLAAAYIVWEDTV